VSLALIFINVAKYSHLWGTHVWGWPYARVTIWTVQLIASVGIWPLFLAVDDEKLAIVEPTAAPNATTAMRRRRAASSGDDARILDSTGVTPLAFIGLILLVVSFLLILDIYLRYGILFRARDSPST